MISEDRTVRARNVSLEKFLPYRGYTLLKHPEHRGRMTLKELEGVSITNCFYTYEKEGRGGNSIDFCVKELGMRFSEAVEVLNAFADVLEKK
jgi:hypothetical protein